MEDQVNPAAGPPMAEKTDSKSSDMSEGLWSQGNHASEKIGTLEYTSDLLGDTEEFSVNLSEYGGDGESCDSADKLDGFSDYIRFVSSNYEGEMLLGIRRKRGRGRPHSKKQEYSKELAALVGQANLAYTKKQYTEAVEILHKVIKAAPHAQQPWMTLGMIHEELGNSQKALQSYLVAAHMSPKDIDQWRRLGSMSLRFGHDSQALYCYSRALIICSTDLEVLHARSELFMRRNQLKRANADLKTILKITPYDMIASQRLIHIYEKFREPGKAIGLYEKIVLRDTDVLKGTASGEKTSGGCKECLMTQQYLLHMADLYIKSGTFDNAWTFLARCYQNITGARGIVSIKTPDEANRRLKNAPARVLARFGIVLLHSGNSAVAEQMLSRVLHEYNPDMHNEYVMIADTYVKLEIYKEAISVLEIIKANRNEPDASISCKLAECYAKTNDLAKAADEYLVVIELEKCNHDAKLALAKIYNSIGKVDEANQIALQVKLEDITVFEKPRRKRRSHAPSRKDRRHRSVGEVISLSNSTMRPDKTLDTMDESKILKEIPDLYHQAQALHSEVKDHVSRAEYLKKAYKLIRLFQSAKDLHSNKLKTLENGNSANVGMLAENEAARSEAFLDEPFLVEGSNIPREDIAEFLKLSREFESLGGSKSPQMPIEPNPLNPSKISVKNLTPDQWYNIFIQTAYVAAEAGRYDEAKEILQISSESGLLFNDEKKIKLRLHMICIALNANKLDDLIDHCRRLTLYMPLCYSSYRAYSAFIPTGKVSIPAYTMSSSSKFFIRLANKPPLVLKESANIKTMLNFVPILVTIALISYSNRSFKIATAYLLKAYVLSPRNYMINLILGLSYLHLSSQRTTESRELHITNAFTFLFQYYELRGGDQEACYNIARAFHQIGFTNLAVSYYEKALKICDENGDAGPGCVSLSREAAYNLSRIYLLSGSFGFSYALLSKYCVI